MIGFKFIEDENNVEIRMARLWPLLRRRGLLNLFVGQEDPYYTSLRQSGELLVSPEGETHTRAPRGVRGERHTRLFPSSTIPSKILSK